MKVEIQIDPASVDPRAVIWTAAMTPEVEQAVSALSVSRPAFLIGMKEEKAQLLEPDQLIRVYASAGKVYAVTSQGEYVLRSRLYEVEERLDSRKFVRISNSEIVNFEKVSHFDFSLAGTILVRLKNGTVSYVSRRYVSKIKEILGM